MEKEFIFDVSYRMSGKIKVKGETFEQALAQAKMDFNIGLPENAEYEEGSWQVDEDFSRERPENQPEPEYRFESGLNTLDSEFEITFDTIPGRRFPKNIKVYDVSVTGREIYEELEVEEQQLVFTQCKNHIDSAEQARAEAAYNL